MSGKFWSADGHYSDDFQFISAGEINVPGLPRGSAGRTVVALPGLSSIAGVFTVAPDMRKLLSHGAPASLRKLMPARPATRYARVPELFSIEE